MCESFTPVIHGVVLHGVGFEQPCKFSFSIVGMPTEERTIFMRILQHPDFRKLENETFVPFNGTIAVTYMGICQVCNGRIPINGGAAIRAEKEIPTPMAAYLHSKLGYLPPALLVGLAHRLAEDISLYYLRKEFFNLIGGTDSLQDILDTYIPPEIGSEYIN